MTVVGQDRCPGVLALHEAEDGQLARVRLPGGRISADQLRAVADVAEFGNEIIELTSRASLQIRGLADGRRLSAVLTDAGLLPSTSHERVRNILASPVAGRHPGSVWETDAVVAELDRAICGDPDLAALSGRFLFGVDDGAGLLGHPVDVLIGPGGSVTAAIEAARAAAADRGGGRTTTGPGAGPAVPVGALRQRDGRHAFTFLPPLGRLDPASARGLADLAPEVRLSVRRTLTIVDLDDPLGVIDALDALGMVCDPDSGWVGLSACAGLGACRRATVDVRALAAARARERGPGSHPEHWAACSRHCGLTGGAQLMEVTL